MENTILKIELESIKHTVQHMFSERNSAITEQIIKTIESTITEEWVQVRIQEAVDELLKKSISGVSSNYSVQKSIENIISDNIIKSINSIKE